MVNYFSFYGPRSHTFLMDLICRGRGGWSWGWPYWCGSCTIHIIHSFRGKTTRPQERLVAYQLPVTKQYYQCKYSAKVYNYAIPKQHRPHQTPASLTCQVVSQSTDKSPKLQQPQLDIWKSITTKLLMLSVPYFVCITFSRPCQHTDKLICMEHVLFLLLHLTFYHFILLFHLGFCFFFIFKAYFL